jgi:DNA-binding beta-propeller fold protein YncE
MLKKTAMFILCLTVVGGAALGARSAGRGEKIPEYVAVANWLELPKDFKFGLATAVATDKDDNLFIFHRGKRPIAVFDKTGKFLRSWGDDMHVDAHGLRIDHEGNVWTTDLSTQQVVKYDPMGKVLLTLGTKNKHGKGQDRFNEPADVAVSAAGDIYVADGYVNSRVVKFTKEGKYLKEWGKKGKGPGQFNLVHAIFLDGKGRVYVGDRENDRIQVFDEDGKFLEQWRDSGAPFGLFLQGAQRMLVADGRANLIRILDLSGKVQGRFGQKGTEPGQFLMAHGICADSRGVIYVTEGDGERVQKFVAKMGEK